MLSLLFIAILIWLKYFKLFIDGPYSPVSILTCKHCECQFMSRKMRFYCDDHLSLYHRGAKTPFQFTFDPLEYPLLFDANQIKTVGWYNPKIKYNNGLTKDHIISICDAIKNNYDPYYISHPLNCCIVTQSKNASKGRKSNMTYEELVILVNTFDRNS